MLFHSHNTKTLAHYTVPNSIHLIPHAFTQAIRHLIFYRAVTDAFLFSFRGHFFHQSLGLEV